MSQNAQTPPFALLLPERAGKALLQIAEQVGGIGVLAVMLARRLCPLRIAATS